MKYSGQVAIGVRLKTPVFKQVQRVAGLALAMGDMAAIWGPPGIGKSVAINTFADHVRERGGVRVVQVVVPQHCNRAVLCRRILLAIEGVEPGGTAEFLYQRIKAYFMEPTVLILDEAHRMGLEQFELTRDFRDEDDNEVAVIFVGNQHLWTTLQARQQLADRVTFKTELAGLSHQEFVSMLPLFDDLYQGVDPQLAAELAKRLRSNLRKLAQFTAVARMLMAEQGVTVLDRSIVLGAILLMRPQSDPPTQKRAA